MRSFKDYYDKNLSRFLQEWQEFLRFPSISALPEHAKDCRKCADWLLEHLKRIGFPQVEIIQTAGQPVVLAHYPGKADASSILYYGHYDVYQTNPLIPWTYGAFEPTLSNGRMYARGAQDNKGQTFFFLKALETLLQQNLLNCPVTLLLEGEEETTTSAGLTALLPEIKERIKSDVLLVCDTECKDINTPSIVLGLRGIVNFSFRLEGIHSDLHSGAHGGVVKNPAQEMIKLLATLHQTDGSIAIPGFYDQVSPISAEEKLLIQQSDIDIAQYIKDVGVPPSGGERNISSIIERRGFRPTLEINGVYAGYIGPGVKTIIPAYSNAKLTARLVAGQNPETCLQAIEDHIKLHAPKDLKLLIEEKGSGGPGIRIRPDSQVIRQGRMILNSLFKNQATFSWEGSSVPLVASLLPEYAKTALLVGFGLEEDRVHAADESFSLQQFENGYLYACSILQELGKKQVAVDFAI